MEKFDIELARSILGALKCEKGLICAKSGLETLCKAQRIGSDTHMICLEESPRCSFEISFGHGYMCKCPVRIFISKEFRK
jgi:hypothetical protein